MCKRAVAGVLDGADTLCIRHTYLGAQGQRRWCMTMCGSCWAPGGRMIRGWSMSTLLKAASGSSWLGCNVALISLAVGRVYEASIWLLCAWSFSAFAICQNPFPYDRPSCVSLLITSRKLSAYSSFTLMPNCASGTKKRSFLCRRSVCTVCTGKGVFFRSSCRALGLGWVHRSVCDKTWRDSAQPSWCVYLLHGIVCDEMGGQTLSWQAKILRVLGN